MSVDPLSLTIQQVAKRSGLSQHVIRIWERRYAAVVPRRTDTGRRVYGTEQLERLQLLAKLTQVGCAIGSVARLSTEQLSAHLRDLSEAEGGGPASRLLAEQARRNQALDTGLAFYDEGIRAVIEMNEAGLNRVLDRASLHLGTQGVLLKVAAPLAQGIGLLWRSGELGPAQEHFASAVLRNWLEGTSRGVVPPEGSPVLVVATPLGQVHELGALLVAALARNLGWRVTYLGSNLPAMDIAGVALRLRARAVALSLVYPDDDANLPAELLRLSAQLSPSVTLIAGGRAAESYARACSEAGIVLCLELAGLGGMLDQLRRLD